MVKCSIILYNSNNSIERNTETCNCLVEAWNMCSMCDSEYVIDVVHRCDAECSCKCICDWKDIICHSCSEMIYDM